MADGAGDKGSRIGVLSPVRLATVEHGRWNNINLIRLVLASLVVFSHSFVILDRYDDEPMRKWLGFSDLGSLAVCSFFLLSGYLILKSALRSSPERFILARVLRLFPALALVSVLSALVLGPLLTTLPRGAYLRDGGTWSYLLNALLHIEHATLPGVFGTHRDAFINRPLWTLTSEWLMYLLLWVVCLAVGLRRERRVSFRLILLFIVGLAFTLTLPALPWKYGWKWFMFAGIGGCVYLLRRHIPLSIPVALGLLAATVLALLTVPFIGKMLYVFAVVYLLLVIGFHPALHVRGFHRFGDYSYGVYIFAWPLQQLLVPHVSRPIMLFLAAYPLVLLAAIVSWHLVEGPCLQFRDSLWHRQRPTP